MTNIYSYNFPHSIIADTEYDIVAVPRGRWQNAFKLNDFVTGIEWHYSLDQAALALTIELNPNEEIRALIGTLVQRTNRAYLDVGDYIILFGHKYDENDALKFDEIYRTVITEPTFVSNGSDQAITLLTYENTIYAQLNEVAEVLPPEDAYTRIGRLSAKYGIPFDGINSVNPGVLLSGEIVRKRTLWEIFLNAILESNARSSVKFLLRTEKGLLKIKQRSIPKTIWVIEQGHNLIAISRKRSMMEMRNEIEVRGQDTFVSSIVPNATGEQELGQRLALQRDATSITEFGLLKEIIFDSRIKDQTQANLYAYRRLQAKGKPQETVQVRANNINGLNWGDPLFIYEESTRTMAVYWIYSGRHRVDADNGAVMDLVLTLEDRYELLEYLGQKRGAAAKSEIDKIIEQTAGGRGGINTPVPVVPGSIPEAPSQPVGTTANVMGFLSLPFVPDVSDNVLTQDYGEDPATYQPQGYIEGHPGLDFDLDGVTNWPVNCAAKGTVRTVRFGGQNGDPFTGRGRYIVIDHHNGFETYYLHLQDEAIVQSYLNKIGQVVEEGEVLGYAGTTGGVALHLHFGLRRTSLDEFSHNNRGFVDPKKYFKSGTVIKVQGGGEIKIP